MTGKAIWSTDGISGLIDSNSGHCLPNESLLCELIRAWSEVYEEPMTLKSIPNTNERSDTMSTKEFLYSKVELLLEERDALRREN